MAKRRSKTAGSPDYDAVVIGSGPNGLAAAIKLAIDGASVLVVERNPTPGGGMRTQALTRRGFLHDVCSAVHPMGAASPFFRSLNLEEVGLEWLHPEVALAHPLDGDRCAVMLRDFEETCAGLGDDGAAYRRCFGPLVCSAEALFGALLGPLTIPRHPLAAARFGMRAVASGLSLARGQFQGDEAQALFAGNAAHSILPLDRPLTAAVAVMLMTAAHAVGWPVAKGGSGSIAAALCRRLEEVGGEIQCEHPVASMDDLPSARAYFFDTSPGVMSGIAGERLPARYRARLARFRHGPGIFKLDLALSEPIPWRSEACCRAGTVHVGGALEEIVRSERACWHGEHSGAPFVLAAQPCVVDPSRAPRGKAVAWLYCHVPSGSTVDMSEPILRQVERFAPGFRDTILESRAMNCEAVERYNPNYIGGDITGGVIDWRQLFTRPVARWNPYSTPAKDIFICSASTPPGAGVHGMCGWQAARRWKG